MQKRACLFPSLFLLLGSLPVAGSPVFHVNPPKLPSAIVGKTYTGGPLVLQGGGQCPRNIPTVKVVAGALPSGMYLTDAGQFGGAPLEPGRYEFVVRVENGCGWADQPMSLDVTGAPFLSANPASFDFRIAPGQAIAPVALQVSGNSPGIIYTAGASVAWLMPRPRAGRTPAEGSALVADLVDVQIDTANLPPGVHRGLIEIGGFRMARPLVVPVRVEVDGGAGIGAPGEAGATPDPRLPRIEIGNAALPSSPLNPASAHGEAGQQKHEPAPSTHGVGGGHDAHGAPAKPGATKPASKPTAVAGRLSRSAQLRSKYLASKSAPAAAPADAHAKPSSVGEPVKKPAADVHAKPAAAKPAADAHGKPAADAHAKPAADAHAKPAAAKPAADAHAKPAAAKPAADAHGKPADSHGKSADKPKEAAKH